MSDVARKCHWKSIERGVIIEGTFANLKQVKRTELFDTYFQ